jgi:hypothetical protein
MQTTGFDSCNGFTSEDQKSLCALSFDSRTLHYFSLSNFGRVYLPPRLQILVGSRQDSTPA